MWWCRTINTVCLQIERRKNASLGRVWFVILDFDKCWCTLFGLCGFLNWTNRRQQQHNKRIIQRFCSITYIHNDIWIFVVSTIYCCCCCFFRFRFQFFFVSRLDRLCVAHWIKLLHRHFLQFHIRNRWTTTKTTLLSDFPYFVYELSSHQ